jgi:hypothetical protein
MVKGLKIVMPHSYNHLCHRCAQGKSHQLPLPKASTTKYSKLELVMMDLTGPMSVPTWDGHLYALVVVEASCHYPVGRLLKSKDQAGKEVRDVIVMMEQQSGLCVK